ncbi:PAS domain-containing protein [Burkholderiaceae bacterium UC74_6]
MELQQAQELRWRQAIEAGELGVWDLRPELETVHHSPQWKQRLGFPEPHAADSTHFWRCRVHPEDLQPMLAAIYAHVQGERPFYEAQFRLRSNGSGYRVLHSRGRVIERSAEGRAVRMVGTMVDLTGRPATPRGGLLDGPRGPMGGLPLAVPFHQLLDGADLDTPLMTQERLRVLNAVADLLDASVAELELSLAG